MIRTRMWAIASVVLGSALAAGMAWAQPYQPTPQPNPTQASPGMSPAATGQPQARIYEAVSPDTLGTESSAALLFHHYVKLADVFQNEVKPTRNDWPPEAARAGWTSDKYYAFLTQRAGSNLICFVSLDNPDVALLKAADPTNGAHIFLMGRVGNRIAVSEGGARVLEVDRVVRGDEEPKPPVSTEKKPVMLTIERYGPDGMPMKQEFKIPKPGVKYRIPDPSDPANDAKAMYVTLQF